MSNILNIGLDVGSITVKLVVLNEDQAIVYKNYLRHFSNIRNTVVMMLEDAKAILNGHVLP